MPTFVLATSVAVLYAAEVPLPVEITALAMVAVVLRWLLSRENTAVLSHEARVATLEADMANVRAEASEQRHLKHEFINRVTGMQAAIALVLASARSCSCGAMEPILPVLDQLSIPTKENPQ